MAVEKFVLAGHLFYCIKCNECFGRLNKMDSTGEVEENDSTLDEYKEKMKMMEEEVKNTNRKLLTISLDGVTCNKCLLKI